MDPDTYMRMVNRQRVAMRHQGQDPFLRNTMRAWASNGRLYPRYRPLVDVLL